MVAVNLTVRARNDLARENRLPGYKWKASSDDYAHICLKHVSAYLPEVVFEGKSRTFDGIQYA